MCENINQGKINNVYMCAVASFFFASAVCMCVSIQVYVCDYVYMFVPACVFIYFLQNKNTVPPAAIRRGMYTMKSRLNTKKYR